MKLIFIFRSAIFPFFLTAVPVQAQNIDKLQSQNFEKLEVKKARTFKLSKEEAKQMEEDVKNNFIQGFNNSSPEVQKALLKAAKETSEQKSKASKSNSK